MYPGFSVFMNHKQTNGSESPHRYIIIVSKRNNQTNFSDVDSKPGTLFLSDAGDCHNMAGTLCITHPIKMFSLNSVNYSLIIRSNPSLFLLTYLIVIQYTNNYEALLQLKLQVILLCVAKFHFVSYWLKSMKYFIAKIHTQLFNYKSLLSVQKFSIDFRGCDGDNFPNYYCDLFSSHPYHFMLTTVPKPLEKLHLL